MKKAIFMAALIAALVWFDAAFLETGAQVWQMPQQEGGVWGVAWVNNQDVLLVRQIMAEPDPDDYINELYTFYLQRGNQPPQSIGSLELGGHMLHCQATPLREGLMLDIHRRKDQLWFYDERSQSLQQLSDADRPQPENLAIPKGEYDGFKAFWAAEGKYIIYRSFDDGTIMHRQSYSLSFYDAASGEESLLAELKQPCEIFLAYPGAYVGEKAGPNRWLTMSIGGELVEITLPQPEEEPQVRIWQAKEEWPPPEPNIYKSGYYWHFGLIPGTAQDWCWLEQVGNNQVIYRVVDLQTGELIASWELEAGQADWFWLLDVYGSRYYLAELPDYKGLTGMRIWACDYLTGEREIIWQDNLTWWKQRLFETHFWGADYINGGMVSPDGSQLIFWSAYDYVRRLPLS